MNLKLWKSCHSIVEGWSFIYILRGEPHTLKDCSIARICWSLQQCPPSHNVICWEAWLFKRIWLCSPQSSSIPRPIGRWTSTLCYEAFWGLSILCFKWTECKRHSSWNTNFTNKESHLMLRLWYSIVWGVFYLTLFVHRGAKDSPWE